MYSPQYECADVVDCKLRFLKMRVQVRAELTCRLRSHRLNERTRQTTLSRA